MKKSQMLHIILVLLLGAAVGALSAQDHWPTWRGPDTMGIAPESNPPTTWSETQNIKWKVKLTGDASNSSPIVWGDKIFFQAAVDTGIKDTSAVAAPAAENAAGRRSRGRDPGRGGDLGRGRGRGRDSGRGGTPGRGPGRGFGGRFGIKPPTTQFKFNLVCMDRGTGKVLWEKTACQLKPHQGHHRDHGYASFSPITDGQYVWAHFGSRGIYCYDMQGNQIWSKELPQMSTMFGEGTAPSLAGDALIVVADQRGDSFIFAFDKKTGNLLWKEARDETTTHATPVPVTVDGKLQVIIAATDFTRAYDVQTGDVIWQCGGLTRNVIPTPVVGFGMVYCASGYRGNALQAIRLGQTGDLTGSDAIAWEVDRATPYVPSLLLYQGRLYVCKSKNEVISCYDAKTGKPHFVEQKMDEMKGVYASPVAAAGRVYVVGRNGVFHVLNASDSFEVLAVNRLDDKFDCSPAFAGDEMYLKGKQYLYCIAAAS